MSDNRVDIITMGCSKNLIDSERLMRRFEAKGYAPFHDAPDAGGGIVIVNTCGFIGDAKEESVNMILSLADARREGRFKALYVMGCLSERYREELKAEIPEVDRWYGKFDWNGIVDSMPDLSEQQHTIIKPWERKLSTRPWSAYLKISEGCDRFCAYCAIPLITGRHTSRPEEEIIDEVKRLADEGVREINVIAQDLSSYGKDLYGELRLPNLIDRMADVNGIEWIRLHYAYPSGFPMQLLDVMNERDNVCKYLDLALQHISNPVLTAMRRHINRDETIRLIETMRSKVAGLKLRTTMMVGFPGEGEREFEELMDFVRETRFERLGAFAYCEEEGTYAARNLPDVIPANDKQRRLDMLMELQTSISEQLQCNEIGKVHRVLVDRIEGNRAIGRTQWDSPEVDPEVIIENSAQLVPGQFINVRITDAEPFELHGVKQ